MYNKEKISEVINFIETNHTDNKAKMTKLMQDKFQLEKDRSVYHNDDFAIRFSSSKKNSTSFGNTILAIKTLKKYDSKPFIICLITPDKSHLFLANSTFLDKVSHSSKKLTLDNLTGSFNGTNILKKIGNYDNVPANFEILYKIHEKLGFDGNLERLVENTHNIVGRNEALVLNEKDIENIQKSVDRTIDFMKSDHYNELIKELDNLVEQNKNEILNYSKIENVNIRGREIENLISNQSNQEEGLTTSNDLSDYDKVYSDYVVSIDIKSKMMDKNSAPKGFNIDKLLEFLANDNTIYLSYVIGVENENVYTKLIPVFDETLIATTRIADNWSGQNSRGTTQYDGGTLKALVNEEIDINVNKKAALDFIGRLIG